MEEADGQARIATLLAAAVTAILAGSHGLQAQDNYPERPITLIVPFAARDIGCDCEAAAEQMGRVLGKST